MSRKTLEQTLNNIMDKLGNTHVRVGVTGDRAQVAMFHEYGTQHIPARPFLAPSQIAHAEDYAQDFAELTRLAASGEDLSNEFQAMADTAANYTKSYIADGTSIPPPLDPETVKRKGHDRALVDTGELVDSIVGEVVQGAV